MFLRRGLYYMGLVLYNDARVGAARYGSYKLK